MDVGKSGRIRKSRGIVDNDVDMVADAVLDVQVKMQADVIDLERRSACYISLQIGDMVKAPFLGFPSRHG